jgi:hemolysin D
MNSPLNERRDAREEFRESEGVERASKNISENSAEVIALRPPKRWHDPLKLIQEQPPEEFGRVVLWVVCGLVCILLVWAAFGKLDIIATAEGRLVTQTLVKIVQPAEPGVVKEILANEGDSVRAGQVLVKLDTTLATADKVGVSDDLAIQGMQVRRLEAELGDIPMAPIAGDNPKDYAYVHGQYIAHRKAYLDSLDQEKSLLIKMEHEHRSAEEVAAKLEETLPIYRKEAESYSDLEKEGYVGGLAAAQKRRDLIEKKKDLDAQRSSVAALTAAIAAQKKRVAQVQSAYKAELEKELSDVRTRIVQLRPSLDKTIYKEGLMELRAPQDGSIKDLATTTIGAVVQPGTVVMTLVPKGEQFYADVEVKNEDVGFVQPGQNAQIKLATYPFQKYGMLTGVVMRISADASEVKQPPSANRDSEINNVGLATYKARIKLDHQSLIDPHGGFLPLSSGMQITAEINQGKRTVLEYLLSPVSKAVGEAARER